VERHIGQKNTNFLFTTPTDLLQEKKPEPQCLILILTSVAISLINDTIETVEKLVPSGADGNGIMDEDIKRGLKKMAKDTQVKVAESILRWKYKKEGKKVPDEEDIGRQSEELAHQAHEIVAKRGKKIWNEIKRAYQNKQKKGGSSD